MTTILVAQAETETPTQEVVQEAAEIGAHGAGDTHASTEHESYPFPPFNAATFPSQLLWLAITFAALYMLMSRVALPRIGAILEDRKARIDADLAAADASRQKTDAAIAAYEQALATARRNAQALAEETRSKVQGELDAKRKGVEADLAAKVKAAESNIAAAKSEALTHVADIATETAQALVGKLVGPVGEQDARAAVAQVIKE